MNFVTIQYWAGKCWGDFGYKKSKYNNSICWRISVLSQLGQSCPGKKYVEQKKETIKSSHTFNESQLFTEACPTDSGSIR